MQIARLFLYPKETKIMKNTFSNQQEILQMLTKSAELKRDIPTPVLEPTKIEKAQDDNMPMIGLNGIKVEQDGVLSRSGYFDMLEFDRDKYSDIVFTEVEAKRISMSLRTMSTGINAAVPMICAGEQCAFATGCPYVEAGKPPIARPCLVEGQLITYWTKQFIEEFDVDVENYTEVQLVSELAEFNIYELRVTKYLADKHPTLMQDVITTVDNNGEVIENQEISRAFDLKERIKRNRMKVLEALMATRKERIKITTERNKGQSTSAKLTELREKLEEYLGDVARQEPVDAKVVEDETI